LGRFTADGSADTTFTPATHYDIYSIVMQTDGEILVGGASGLKRLNTDGTLDTNFNATGFSLVYSMAIQPDGKILVGGPSSSKLYQYIGRLKIPDRPSESLMFSNSTLTWLRNGAGQEVERASFAVSTNLADWILLGSGTRIPGGWQLATVSVPPGATIRACGFTATAASSWPIESFRGPAAISSPILTINWSGNRPVLSVAADAGRPYALEYISSLEQGDNWQSLSYVLLTNNNQVLPDQPTVSDMQRFYRMRLNQ
jgi:hypothetical protein